MESTLSPSAVIVQKTLDDFGLSCKVLERAESTRTADEAAAVVGCHVGQIVKSLVFRGKVSQQPLLVTASGANRVDEKKLQQLAGEKIGRADAAFVRDRTGFAIGGIPPVGHREALTTFIDQDLLQFDEIWAAAGTPNTLFRLTPLELVMVTGGTVADVREETLSP